MGTVCRTNIHRHSWGGSKRERETFISLHTCRVKFIQELTLVTSILTQYKVHSYFLISICGISSCYRKRHINITTEIFLTLFLLCLLYFLLLHGTIAVSAKVIDTLLPYFELWIPCSAVLSCRTDVFTPLRPKQSTWKRHSPTMTHPWKNHIGSQLLCPEDAHRFC